jgi:hypothetical protein
MQTNNLLQFIVVTLAVMETAVKLFGHVERIMAERNAQCHLSERNAQRGKSERNAQRRFFRNSKRTRN